MCKQQSECGQLVLDIGKSREGFERDFFKSTTELEVESGIFFGARLRTELSHFGKKSIVREEGIVEAIFSVGNL